ncbi:hypothetical protein D3C75_1261830 [compost metagenome]
MPLGFVISWKSIPTALLIESRKSSALSASARLMVVAATRWICASNSGEVKRWETLRIDLRISSVQLPSSVTRLSAM